VRYRKRIFTPHTFFQGIVRLLLNAPAFVAALARGRVHRAFRERILLAASGVNDCRYCIWFHTRLARATGLSDGEIGQILASQINQVVPEEELVGVLYAQHYAQTGGNPGPESVRELEAFYGKQTARDIRVFTQAIHFANLLGNTFDALVLCNLWPLSSSKG